MPFCQKCGNEIKDDSSFCGKCGSPSTNHESLRNVVKKEEAKKGIFTRKLDAKTSAKVLIGTFLFLGFLTYAISTEKSDAQVSKPKEVSDLSFYDIRDKLENMTEAQFNSYSKEIKGKRIRWTGWVEDVNEKMMGGYELWVDMDSPNKVLSVQDVQFDIPENIALELKKDRKITFEGDVESVINILGSCQINLEKTEIITN